MRLVQLSDTHIVPQNRQPIHRHDTLERLGGAIDAVNELKPLPDLIVFTGDQVNDELDDSYYAFKEAISDLKVQCCFSLGNHDSRAGFCKIMLETVGPNVDRYYYSLDIKGRRFLVLDTLDEGMVSGKLDDSQLDWLEKQLDIELPVTICMHHPPIPVGVPWMDKLILQDSDRFINICKSHVSPGLILCGHVHHSFQMRLNNMTVLTAPSVGMQFRKTPLINPDGTRNIVKDAPGAFRIIDFEGYDWKTEVRDIAVKS